MRQSDSAAFGLRWLISALMALAIVAVCGIPVSATDDGWIGKRPPTGMVGPREQIFLHVHLEGAVADQFEGYLGLFRQRLRENRLIHLFSPMPLNPPEIIFAARNHADIESAIEALRAIAPAADIGLDGTNIRIRFGDSAIRRMERDALLETSNWWRVGNPKLRPNYPAKPDIRVYVHESGCIRIDGIGLSALDDGQVYDLPFSSVGLVPLYPTQDPDSDHLPDGFFRLPVERMRQEPASNHGEGAFERRDHDSKPVGTARRKPGTFIVAGRPILSGWGVVNAEADIERGQPAIVLELDMMAEAHLAGRLPRFEGRRIGFVVDGTVIGTFDRFTLSGSRLVLWGGPTDEQARRMADLLGAHLMPSGFKFTDACPARDPDR